MHDLSTKQIAALGDGMNRVARNLYLYSANGGSKRSWVFLYNSPRTGKRTEMGLGSCDLISVARAKELALRHRLAVLEGRCPLAERRGAQEKAKPRLLTFREVAELCHAAHLDSFKNDAHKKQWIQSLETYAFPVLRDVPIAEVDVSGILRVLEPIWRTKAETANRTRGRIEKVLDYAAARGWRSKENPARWRDHLKSLLPHRSTIKGAEIKHLAALPWAELPALWVELSEIADRDGDRDQITALGLQWVLLNAVRNGEGNFAQWSEIDREKAVWIVPGERMKMRKPHTIPLSTVALALLDKIEAVRQNDWLFPGSIPGKAFGRDAMQLFLLRLRPGCTVHGTTRSGFKDWCRSNGVSHDLSEAALAHSVGDETDKAYSRDQLIEPRRPVMENWATFLTTGGNRVVALPKAA